MLRNFGIRKILFSLPTQSDQYRTGPFEVSRTRIATATMGRAKTLAAHTPKKRSNKRFIKDLSKMHILTLTARCQPVLGSPLQAVVDLPERRRPAKQGLGFGDFDLKRPAKALGDTWPADQLGAERDQYRRHRNQLAGTSKAAAIRHNNAAVDRSSSSETRNVWLAAAGWSMQVTIRSTRLPRKTRLRRFPSPRPMAAANRAATSTSSPENSPSLPGREPAAGG